MKQVGVAAQQLESFLYRADATMTGSAQLVLARSMARSYLLLQNSGSNVMYLEIGAGAAHATISGGAVTAITVDNGGFGFTRPPQVMLYGGGYAGNTSYGGLGQPLGAAPSNVARAHAVLTGGAISSIVVDNPGALYVCAPYVHIYDDPLDPYGAAVPTIGTGIQLVPGQQMVWEGTMVPTEAISVIGTASDILVCRWSE